MSVIIIGRPAKPQPDKKCGCRWVEQPGGTHHGKNIWSLKYNFERCAKHAAAPTPHQEKGK